MVGFDRLAHGRTRRQAHELEVADQNLLTTVPRACACPAARSLGVTPSLNLTRTSSPVWRPGSWVTTPIEAALPASWTIRPETSGNAPARSPASVGAAGYRRSASDPARIQRLATRLSGIRTAHIRRTPGGWTTTADVAARAIDDLTRRGSAPFARRRAPSTRVGIIARPASDARGSALRSIVSACNYRKLIDSGRDASIESRHR